MSSGAEQPTTDAEVEYLVVATVRRPHGVRGEIVVAVETDRPDAVFRTGRTLWLGDAAGRPLGGSLTIEKARPLPDGMLLRVREHSDRTPELESLRGSSLMIVSTEASPRTGDEVHYRELRGMAVFHREERVGVVQSIMETPGGELLVVRRSTGKELLIPFVKQMVTSVDRDARRIDIDPPDGLLEL
jgi:16S rRNA processing protein RimM